MHIMNQNSSTSSFLSLANRIHSERLRRGLTLVELGSACGVHHSQLSRIEKGNVTRVSKNIKKICTFLQIELTESTSTPKANLLLRVERLITASNSSARAIESLVTALEELTHG